MNMISCWEKMLTLISPLKNGDIEEGKTIFLDDSFTEFLNFCKEKGCFPTEDVFTVVRYGVCDYEDGDSNYSEENCERRNQLLNVLFGE